MIYVETYVFMIFNKYHSRIDILPKYEITRK